MSLTTNHPAVIDTAHLRLAEFAALGAWGDRQMLEVVIRPASDDRTGEMAFIGYGEGVAAWAVYWLNGLLWLAYLPDQSGHGPEGWTVNVASVAEAMECIMEATKE